VEDGRVKTRAATLLRDAAIFAPCYIALDWASYIDPLGPFNITPWNPQPALAIVWMLLGGLSHLPTVLASILLADVVVRHAPGGYAITLLTAVALASGYAAMAWALRRLLSDLALRTARDLAVLCGVVLAGTALLGAAFVGILFSVGKLGETAFLAAWVRFWVGDAVGVLVTAPLLLAAADVARRNAFFRMLRLPEPLVQAAVLCATVWLIFNASGGDPARHFYLLFLPLIWVSVRSGMNGAILATAIVQIGVVLGIHQRATSFSAVELQALVAALTLTGLFLGVIVDERQRAEEKLRHSLRLAAAGEMAGAVAHEVNQPLTALMNYGRSAQMLLEDAADSRLRLIIAKVLLEAERASEVVRRLRDFFRSGTTQLQEVEAASLLAAARRIGETTIGVSSISLEVGAGQDLPAVYVDRLQVELVLRNLIANAVESLLAAKQENGRINVTARREGPQHLRVVVADNGPGLPSATRQTLFQPFISGKPTGMGLGLAVSRAIAEAHGGSLEAKAADHGEFHLILPCVQST
jgi:two-component system sensor kinase FixL